MDVAGFVVVRVAIFEVSHPVQPGHLIRSVKVLVLHHKLGSRSKQPSLQLIQIMIELIRLLSLLIHIRIINTELRLPNNHIAIAKINHQISIRCLKSVFDSDNFEVLACFSLGRVAHVLKHLHDLAWSATMYFTP
jgi:desulfoferrodoxin (superoxide reductase-like protein)